MRCICILIWQSKMAETNIPPTVAAGASSRMRGEKREGEKMVSISYQIDRKALRVVMHVGGIMTVANIFWFINSNKSFSFWKDEVLHKGRKVQASVCKDEEKGEEIMLFLNGEHIHS